MVDKNPIKEDKRYNENAFQKVIHWLVVQLLKLISILPFWVIYGISDVMYLLLRYIVRYRKKVIIDNLKHAFPEKNQKEHLQIMAKFYRHFCDFLFETLKLHSMSEKQLNKRLSVNGVDEANKYAEQGKSIVLLGFHYNNWEWASSIQSKSKLQLLMIYNPLRGNQALEDFISYSRGKWGGKSIPVQKSARVAIEYMKKGEPAALWLAADQTPPANSPFWTIFLNREAPFFSGPEKIAIKTNQPVFFVYLSKKSRGRYEANFSMLFEDPRSVEPKEILLTYIRKIEGIIREEPAYYLWSHRRWKHTRPEGIPLTT